jgi:adenylate kinase family enzyme
MRAEAEKPTKEGERLKKTMADGGLVPTEQTVAILVSGMVSNPSPAYLIDGFPRSTDQALFFEQNVLECQRILFFDVTEETMYERCMKRAETSGRTDDNPETMKKRVTNYLETSAPVIDYYDKFGKVVAIDSNGTRPSSPSSSSRWARRPPPRTSSPKMSVSAATCVTSGGRTTSRRTASPTPPTTTRSSSS